MKLNINEVWVIGRMGGNKERGKGRIIKCEQDIKRVMFDDF